MALFDIFKKKKEEKKLVRVAEEKKARRPKKEVKKEKPSFAEVPAAEVERKPEKEAEPVKPKRIIKSKVAWKVLEQPHITEKATALTEANQYIFTVAPYTNKTEIKQAVEDVYGVNVENVRMVNISGKKRRLGRTKGWKKGYKKAIVSIKKGQEIEILPR